MSVMSVGEKLRTENRRKVHVVEKPILSIHACIFIDGSLMELGFRLRLTNLPNHKIKISKGNINCLP